MVRTAHARMRRSAISESCCIPLCWDCQDVAEACTALATPRPHHLALLLAAQPLDQACDILYRTHREHNKLHQSVVIRKQRSGIVKFSDKSAAECKMMCVTLQGRAAAGAARCYHADYPQTRALIIGGMQHLSTKNAVNLSPRGLTTPNYSLCERPPQLKHPRQTLTTSAASDLLPPVVCLRNKGDFYFKLLENA
ncbi:hypothetical protein J6590_016463 [Homalodisca vitripennis]|nr:hypothetical protein J6590_016463 [Homalodisca vitripennis]